MSKEEIKEFAVRLNIMRNEADVLKESKIKMSTEIRQHIRERNQIIDEIKELNEKKKGLINEIELSKSKLDKLEKQEVKINSEIDTKNIDISERLLQVEQAEDYIKDLESETIEKANSLEDRIEIIDSKEKDVNKRIDIISKALEKCQ